MAWTNNNGLSFPTKADAFDWLNKEIEFTDMPHLKHGEELRYSRTPFGIYDHWGQCYVKGLLPIERYN